MICRSTTIRHRSSGVSLRTPVLIPSFSSKGFQTAKNGKSEAATILQAAGEFLTQCYLISAYDIYHGYIPKPGNLPFLPDLLFLDSGGYEVSDAYDYSVVVRPMVVPKEWRIEYLESVLDSWPSEIPAVFVSFDQPTIRKPFLDQVQEARSLFKGRNQLLTFLIKPETKSQFTIEKSLRGALAAVDELSGFDFIGLTEKELGPSMLDRMVNVAKLRKALDEAGLSAPVHIFGSLDPLSVCLYFLAGAELFDGLTWIRYGYNDGLCLYTHNIAATKYGIDFKDDHCKLRMLSENCYLLEGLQLRLQEFASTGSFKKLDPHAKVLKDALDTLNSRLRGGA
ncbi:MAG: hypothetical protein WAV28_10800 [Sedimentisphaerales bacterium]